MNAEDDSTPVDNKEIKKFGQMTDEEKRQRRKDKFTYHKGDLKIHKVAEEEIANAEENPDAPPTGALDL